MTHYDPCLREYLPANNSNSGVVLNNQFSMWEEHISENIKKRNGEDRYESDADKELLKICQEHEKAYEKEIESDNIIFLTHPFYLTLTHMDELNNDTQRDADIYLNNLLSLLNQDLPRYNMNLVVLETLHHYAAATSLLLENGIVDKVIFSEYDSGYLLDSFELRPLSKKDFFIAGGYNKNCLESTFKEVYNVVFHPDQVYAIKDIIIDSPQERHKSLKPRRIYVGSWNHLSKDHILTLDELTKTILGIESEEVDNFFNMFVL